MSCIKLRSIFLSRCRGLTFAPPPSLRCGPTFSQLRPKRVAGCDFVRRCTRQHTSICGGSSTAGDPKAMQIFND